MLYTLLRHKMPNIFGLLSAHCFVVAFTLFAFPASAIPRKNQQFTADIYQNIELGRGWDSRTQTVTDEICVEFNMRQESINATDGQFRLVTSTHELMNTLGITAEQELSLAAGLISAKGKMKMALNIDINAASSTLLSQKKVLLNKQVTSPESGKTTGKINAVHLRDAVSKLGGNSSQEFRERCGDSYIEQVIYGGELYLFTQLQENSSEIRQNNAASFQHANKITGTALSGKLLTDLTTRFEQEQISTTHRVIGGPDIQISQDPKEFAAIFNNWSVSNDTATPLYFVVKRYPDLAKENSGNIPKAHSEHEKIAAAYWNLVNLRPEINQITDINAEELYALNRQTLTENQRDQLDDQLEDDIKELRNLAETCLKNLNKSSQPKSADKPNKSNDNNNSNGSAEESTTSEVQECQLPAKFLTREYDYRMKFPMPYGPEIDRAYLQPKKEKLARYIYQYWIKDLNNVRLNNASPLGLSNAELSKYKDKINALVKERPARPSVSLGGSHIHSCTHEPFWNDNDESSLNIICGDGAGGKNTTSWRITKDMKDKTYDNCHGELKEQC